MTLFVPDLFQHDDKGLAIPQLNPGTEWVPKGEGNVTIMVDGQCLKRENNAWYRRKRSDGLIYWIPLEKDNPADQILWECIGTSGQYMNGYYEAIGPSINGNPQGCTVHRLVRTVPYEWSLNIPQNVISRGPNITVQQLYDAIKTELSHPETDVEGIVFHKEIWENGTVSELKAAKVRRKEFGLAWPIVRAVVPVGVGTA